MAVVPTARGRPGVHPLRGLIGDSLALPRAELSARPRGLQVRDLDPERFSVSPLPGARVLLIDDTWTTGSSAQSAAIALRGAGQLGYQYRAWPARRQGRRPVKRSRSGKTIRRDDCPHASNATPRCHFAGKLRGAR